MYRRAPCEATARGTDVKSKISSGAKVAVSNGLSRSPVYLGLRHVSRPHCELVLYRVADPGPGALFLGSGLPRGRRWRLRPAPCGAAFVG
jgi:hypothetical protein